MSRAKISISINVEDILDLKKDITLAVARQSRSEINDRLSNLNSEIKEIFLEALFKTPVWGALSGEYAGDENRDLQAQLGITFDILGEFALEVTELLEESVEISNVVISNKGDLKFTIKISPLDIQNLENASFISENGDLIAWFDWLTNGHSIIGYDVLFTESANSRTGRAVMVNYVAPSIVWSAEYLDFAGSDFIAEILSSPDFEILLAALLERTLREVFNG